jgi:multidrug efflux pump subunit AcrB
VRAALIELAGPTSPTGSRSPVFYDFADFVRASLREVVVTLFIAAVLVILTVLVFLQDFRATIIPAVTIPVSIIGTFAVLARLGFGLNMLTLFGLVLAIGIVVDDAIVVVENTARNMEKRGSIPKRPPSKSMREITGPVVATTLVLLAVFVPASFLGGITGVLYRQFGLTISVATLISSINALTLSPALCGVLLRKNESKPFAPFRLFNAGSIPEPASTVWTVGGRPPVASSRSSRSSACSRASWFALPGGAHRLHPQRGPAVFFVNVSSPRAKVARTDAVLREVEKKSSTRRASRASSPSAGSRS